MKPFFKTTLIATSLMLALTTACTTEKSSSEEAKTIHLNNQMKSSELADAGEQLVGPYTFMLADKAFDMALEKDAANQKSQFYKAFLKRFMVFKGIVRRIAPVIRQGSQKQQVDYANWLKQFPESPLKAFLLDGPEDITSGAKAMRILIDYNKALNDFRVLLKKNPTMELTLNLNPQIFEQEINKEYADCCSWKPGSDGAGGGTAYDLTTIEQIAKDESLKDKNPQELLAYYKSLPSLAKLNADHTLNLIPELGSDLSASLKWAKQYQDRLCPKGPGVENQRRGYLFKSGICLTDASEVDKSIAAIDQIFGGIFTQPLFDQNDRQTGQIRVNLAGFLKAPPQDLKNILPEEVVVDGKVTRWSVNNFCGLFPEGDISKITQK